MKELMKSKTFWIGVGMFLIAGCHAIKAQVPALAALSDEDWKAIMESVQVGGTGLGLIFLRLALGKFLPKDWVS